MRRKHSEPVINEDHIEDNALNTEVNLEPTFKS
jgi:hypothetical protein